MPTIADLAGFLNEFAPQSLAESWDNVGLLVGDQRAAVARVMTCLTITPSSAQEAIDRGANLIVTHHPLPFKALKQLTTATPEGRLLLSLIAAKVAIYSPHTGFDSARQGINQRLAEGLGLAEIQPLLPGDSKLGHGDLGAGRFGRLAQPVSLRQLIDRVKGFLSIGQAQAVGALDLPVSRVAVACGSAGEFLGPARLAGCQALVTGEVRFHTCLEAEAWNMGLVLAGHFASERFALERLAEVLLAAFPVLEIWASREERDPVLWV